jgi:hypothetical protein
MINFALCFTKGKALGCGAFPKCEAELGCRLVLGPVSWECPHPGLYPTPHAHRGGQLHFCKAHWLFTPRKALFRYILKNLQGKRSPLTSTLAFRSNQWRGFIPILVSSMRSPHDYRSLGSVSTLTKTNYYYFSKNEFVFKIWNYYFFHHLLLYCDMSNEIIHSIAYDNYDDFQHLNFIFSQIFISQFWGIFNGETDLRVRHLEICYPNLFLLE